MKLNNHSQGYLLRIILQAALDRLVAINNLHRHAEVASDIISLRNLVVPGADFDTSELVFIAEQCADTLERRGRTLSAQVDDEVQALRQIRSILFPEPTTAPEKIRMRAVVDVDYEIDHASGETKTTLATLVLQLTQNLNHTLQRGLDFGVVGGDMVKETAAIVRNHKISIERVHA